MVASNRPFQTKASRVVWACPWYSVRQDELVLPDGRPGVYNVVQHPGAVWVVPVTTAGEVVLLRHYRYTVDDWCWEVPAGGLKADQSPLELAKIELREEIGGTASTWREITTFYTSNGISNEKAYVFLATGVTLAEPAHEPAEVMHLHPTPLQEALQMARSGRITDGPSALALLLCEPYLNG